MPAELNFITIKQSKFDQQPGIRYCCRLSFKVTIEHTKTVCIEFDDDFIEDYFGVTGNDERIRKKQMREIFDSQQNFLWRLGLTKIEEMINNQSFFKVIHISSNDVSWAKRVEEGSIVPDSNEINREFQFYPKRKIGF